MDSINQKSELSAERVAPMDRETLNALADRLNALLGTDPESGAVMTEPAGKNRAARLSIRADLVAQLIDGEEAR